MIARLSPPIIGRDLHRARRYGMEMRYNSHVSSWAVTAPPGADSGPSCATRGVGRNRTFEPSPASDIETPGAASQGAQRWPRCTIQASRCAGTPTRLAGWLRRYFLLITIACLTSARPTPDTRARGVRKQTPPARGQSDGNKYMCRLGLVRTGNVMFVIYNTGAKS